MEKFYQQLKKLLIMDKDLKWHKEIRPFETNQQAIVSLLDFLKQKEAAIARNKNIYYSDKYEKELRACTDEIIPILISSYSELLQCEDFKLLLGQRHIASSFYYVIERDSKGAFYENQVKESVSGVKTLYLGLVEFYYNFNGAFYDNEDAIKLMCKYYPPKIKFNEMERNKIAKALYAHISNAGESSDRGFAYNGIALIKKYIGNVNQDVVENMLMQYTISQIVMRDVYRKQIYTVIKNCSAIEEDKRKMKFHFLDLVLLLDKLSSLILEKYALQYPDIERFHTYDERDMTDGRVDISIEPIFYWSIERKKNAILYL